MAVVFMDSFDHYATAQIPYKYDLRNGDTIVSAGRNGTNCINLSTEVAYAIKSIPSTGTTVVIGGAMYPVGPTSYGNTNEVPLLGFRLGSTDQISLRQTNTGYLTVCRNSTTAIATSTFVAPFGLWTHVQMKVLLSTSATGTVEVKANGTTIISLTNVVTATTSATVDSARISGLRNGGCRWDDLYVCDGGDFLGDCRVECILPSGNGNSSQWVGSDADSTDNYALVDEASADTADFVESSTVSNEDTYAYGDVTPTAGTVHAVQIVPYAAKTDAGSRSIVSVARYSGSETDSSDKALSTTYTFYPDVRETKPGGGGWDITSVNGAEFGIKVTA